jgi:hypothetical protein
MNCPAEDWPDEAVLALRCSLCRGIVVRTSEGVIGVLLGEIQRLSAEVEMLKTRSA